MPAAPPLPFTWFVALRYLLGAQGRTGGTRFLRFVTGVAVGGVAVGVAALLLALMVVRGFAREIEEKIVGFGAHVQVEHAFQAPLGGAAALEAWLVAQPGVVAVTPVASGFALLRTRADIEGVVLQGVPAGSQPFLEERLVAGTFDLGPDAEGRPGVVLGRPLAERLALAPGDPVLALAPRDPAGGALARPRVRPMVVAGVFETGLSDFDEAFVYAGLDAARDLLDLGPDAVSRFDLRLTDLAASPATAQSLGEALGASYLVRSIYQVQASLFAWVNLQRSIIPLVIGVIVLVAAFNIVGMLLMVILEKTREIGVLRSMGAGARAVRRLFLGLGFLAGLVGTGLGLGLALVLGLVQARYRVIPLPQEAYYLDSAPVELHPLDFVLVAAVALALCVLAAYLPARTAARIEPVRAIRFAG